MSLPIHFRADIEESYGVFGWEIANCLYYVAEHKGYKVRDFSAIEYSLEIIKEVTKGNMSNFDCFDGLECYLTVLYPLVHETLIERAKNISVKKSWEEQERQDQVIEDFIEYMIHCSFGKSVIVINDFFIHYIKGILFEEIEKWLPKIDTVEK